ncbi:MAG: adenosylcobinamide amidohydrolase [Methanoregulaceae archaeon]|jgi:adenosylcobinamide hydrolase|nr:adenosylcobinamide amidohydrolase [Methanoregulaceae archaeon]
MRYYLRRNTLFIRGSFQAVSSGARGGIGPAATLVLHAVQIGEDTEGVLENEIAREGLPKDFFGLPVGVPIANLCILQYDFVTVFIAASLDGGITIAACSNEGMTDSGLIGAVMTMTEAKALVLMRSGYDLSGTPADVVIVASEGEPIHESGGPLTEPGRRMREAVIHGVPEALKRTSGIEKRDAPSFFIFSRYGGEHWVEWRPGNCAYYPCHFQGQRCDFCYCPFYPCGDVTLGQQVVSSSKDSMVWNCADCVLLHEPEISDYLTKHPEASLRELKALKKREE